MHKRRLLSLAAICSLAATLAVAPSSTAAPYASHTSDTALVPISPTRIVDSRAGVGAPSALADGQKATIVAAGSVRTTSSSTTSTVIPADADAIEATITAVSPAKDGYLTAWQAGTPQPSTSTVNFTQGRTIAKGVTIPLGSDGEFCVFARGGAHFLVDITGYYRHGTYTDVQGVNLGQERLYDSRESGYGLKAAGAITSVMVGAEGDLVTLNLTSAGATAPGYMTAWPTGKAKPGTSNLNYGKGDLITNSVTLTAGAGGKVDIYTHSPTALIVDRTASIAANSDNETAKSLRSSFTLLSPARRVLDTRDGTGSDRKTGTRVLELTGLGSDPDALGSAIVNVTAVGAKKAGYIAVTPEWTANKTKTSMVNFSPGSVTANRVVVPLSQGGKLFVYSNQETDIVVDILGFTKTPSPARTKTIPAAPTEPHPVFTAAERDIPENSGLVFCGDPRAVKGSYQSYKQDIWNLRSDFVTLTHADGTVLTRELQDYDASLCGPKKVVPFSGLPLGKYTVEIPIDVVHVDDTHDEGLYRATVNIIANPKQHETPKAIEPWGMRYLYDFEFGIDGYDIPTMVPKGTVLSATIAGTSISYTTPYEETFQQVLHDVADTANKTPEIVNQNLHLDANDTTAQLYIIDKLANQPREVPLLTHLAFDKVPAVRVPDAAHTFIGRPGSETNTWKWAWDEGYSLPRANQLRMTTEQAPDTREPLLMRPSDEVAIPIPSGVSAANASAHFTSDSLVLEKFTPRVGSDGTWRVTLPKRSELTQGGHTPRPSIMLTITTDGSTPTTFNIPLVVH